MTNGSTENRTSKSLTPGMEEELLHILRVRFENNMNRHQGLIWAEVQEKLKIHPEKLWSLNQMENTGGEPDVIDFGHKTKEYIFCDFSAESPQGRRSLCYDQEALEARKKDKPRHSAIGMATDMGIEVLTEEQYRILQTLGHFDTTTSSWIITPTEIRKQGGAIFADYRYGQVFIYHNGAESYYSSRGFRGLLRI